MKKKRNYVYVLALYCATTQKLFYKVGVSSQPFKRCYNISLSSKGTYFSLPVARQYVDGDTYGVIRKHSLAYQLESNILKHLKSIGTSYTPDYKFPGSSECFYMTTNELDEFLKAFNFVRYNVKPLPDIFIVDSHLMVLTSKGLWKTNRSAFKGPDGILGALKKERIRKDKELAKFYDAVQLKIESNFKGLNLSRPITDYQKRLKKFQSISNSY